MLKSVKRNVSLNFTEIIKSMATIVTQMVLSQQHTRDIGPVDAGMVVQKHQGIHIWHFFNILDVRFYKLAHNNIGNRE